MKSKLLLLIATATMILASCNTQKDIPYMIGANQLPQEVLPDTNHVGLKLKLLV